MPTESGASHARRSFIKLASASPDSNSRLPNVEHRRGDGSGMVAATATAHASRGGIAGDHEAMTAGAPRCGDDSLMVMPAPPFGRCTSACAESRWRARRALSTSTTARMTSSWDPTSVVGGDGDKVSREVASACASRRWRCASSPRRVGKRSNNDGTRRLPRDWGNSATIMRQTGHVWSLLMLTGWYSANSAGPSD
jgi:hypothetical protein